MDICLLANSLIVLVSKVVEKLTCQEKPREVENEEFMTSKAWVGDYLDMSQHDSRVPMVAIEKMNERLHTKDKISERTLRKVTNTCKRLIELYSMESSRREQLRKIQETIAMYDPQMAEEIELDRFSTCSWYEGRIALWR